MILNVCIGCGCDEVHACQDGEAPCRWLRFRADLRAGVCSACEDLVEGWDRGVLHLQLEHVADRFHRQAMFLYGDEASARAWVDAPHPQLDYRSPRDLILAGELGRVHAVLDQLRDGAFI